VILTVLEVGVFYVPAFPRARPGALVLGGRSSRWCDVLFAPEGRQQVLTFLFGVPPAARRVVMVALLFLFLVRSRLRVLRAPGDAPAPPHRPGSSGTCIRVW